MVSELTFLLLFKNGWVICLSPTLWQGQKTFNEIGREKVHMTLLERNGISPKWNLTLSELTLFNSLNSWYCQPGQACTRWCLVLGSLTEPKEDFLQPQIQPSSVPIKHARQDTGQNLQEPTACPPRCGVRMRKGMLYFFPP